MTRQFDSKNFDANVFGEYVGRVPSVKTSELIARRVFVGNGEIKEIFSGAGNASYAKVPLYGAISGAAQNYDGTTDITPQKAPSYEFGAVTVGRANAWSERDFACDTANIDYMDSVARQVAEYWEEVDEATLLSILKGIFTATSGDGAADKTAFINGHTYDITEATETSVNAVSLNTAIQKACGASKGKFRVALLHSAVASNLENLQLMNYLTYTDEKGITRDLTIGSWNGKSVIITDQLPTSTVGGSTAYTSYILGEGAFFYEDIGAKVPYEMHRNPSEDGGCDILYSRQRKVLHPFGFDYVKASQASLSPTDAELETGTNWELVLDENGDAINEKLIPIARIISLG